MTSRAGDAYLEIQVHTASPIKLRLLLIEGAMRFITQARELAASGEAKVAGETAAKARNIFAEIVANVWSAEGEVARRQKALYGYLLRLATLMQLRGEFEHAEGILKVLAEERETWRQLCEKHAEIAIDRKESMISAPHHIAASDSPASALSLEA